MIIFRVLWGLVLGGCIAFTYRRAWGYEHGKPIRETFLSISDKPRTKETAVWIIPTFLPIMLCVFLVMFWVAGGADGIEKFLYLSLDVMIIVSIYFVALIFLLPVLRKHFSARACATMWLIPIFLFWQVQILLRNAPTPLFVIYIPSHILDVFFSIWVAGFVIMFFGKILSHLLFRHKVMSAAIPVKDPEVLGLFEEELKRVEYRNPVKLVYSDAVTAPLSMGLMKRSRVAVLPNRSFTKQELLFIFRHEIRHIQRFDVDTKVFLAFCGALCWFNPLMWLAIRKASDDLELSCDEIVLEDMDQAQRKKYAELLLDTAGQARGFTTCLSAAAETMRYRLRNVMTIRKRLPGTLLLAISMFLCVMAYGTLGISSDKGSVGELIMQDGTLAADVKSVYYRPEDGDNYGEIWAWGSEGLFSYISALEIEKLNSVGTLAIENGRQLSILIKKNGLMEITLDGKKLSVWNMGAKERSYYYLRSEPDWNEIISYLDFEAKKPASKKLRDPQLWMYFDLPKQDEPMNAVCRSLHIWDINSEETLRAYKNEDFPGGVHGAAPTQVRLVFDLAPYELKITASDWNGTTEKNLIPNMQEGEHILVLEPYSAHYKVELVYEPVDDICYEATYVFDVKYPE